MEMPGETYLFNFSIVAMTYTAVSALVMLLRQTMGGKLSNFDVHLITSFVSIGFVLALNAILPTLITLFEPPPVVLWGIASGLAAVIQAGVLVTTIRRRRKVARGSMPPAVVAAFTLHWLCVAVLVANAAPHELQGVGLFAAAITLDLAVMFWTFVRRIASLLGEQDVGQDWDPSRG